MEEKFPDDSPESLAKHETVKALIDLCSAATRQWVNGEVSRRYLTELSGLAGMCITNAKFDGLDGHRKGTSESKQEADVLLSRLIEMRELLRYPCYASASLASDAAISDTSATRQKLVDQHIQTEPGVDFPEP